MNLFKKSFIGTSILFVFLLGLALIPTDKVDAAITVTVRANGQSSLAVPYGNNSVEISWTSSGATSCSESGGRGGTNTTGFFVLTNMTATQTFTVTCTKPSTCVGNFNCSSLNDVDLCSDSGGQCMGQATSCGYDSDCVSNNCVGGPPAGQCGCNNNSDCNSGFCASTGLCEVCGPAFSGTPSCSVFNDVESTCNLLGCVWYP